MPSLLDRQRELIAYLQTPSAFRGRDGTRLPDVIVPDGGRLTQLGEHALRKRARSARAAFPKTCALLGDRFAAIFADFADVYPTDTIDRWRNARQFHDYLAGMWANTPPDPIYLSDLLKFEAAVWRAWRRPKRQAAVPSFDGDALVRLGCADDIILLRLDHDVRPLMMNADGQALDRRPVFLILRRARGTEAAKILEVPHAVFASLERLGKAPRAAADLMTEAGMDRATLKTLIAQGVLESVL